MKKVSKILVLSCLIVVIVLYVILLNTKQEVYVKNEKSEENNSRLITLMLEIDVGTGNYEESNNNFLRLVIF